MEAEPTRETRARTPLAAVSMRLRGLLRRPFVLRALVIGGLAVAGWLLGAGGAASAASAAVAPSADGNRVSDQIGQLGESVHAGAAHRAAGVLHRLRAEPGNGTATDGPVRPKIDDAGGGLVRAGRETAGHVADDATAPLHHGPIATAAHDRADHIGMPVRHAAGLIDGADPRRSAAAGSNETHGVATPVTSLLGDGTNQTGAPITGSTARHIPSCAPTLAAAMRDGGVRACPAAAASSHGAPAAYGTDGRERLTAGPGVTMRPALGRLSRSRTMCPRQATVCGHGTRPHPQAPAAPAPTGPGSGTYGVVPAPASGPTLPGAGDFAWAHLDHPPRHTATVPVRRGALPPVVRTAADEPALSPD